MYNIVPLKALVSFVVVIGVFILQAQAAILSYDLVIERKLLNLDGFTRDGLTVNKGFIGPTIEATVGDHLLIKVTNHAIMQEVITLHWHGIAQKGTPWADGTAFVANCPITFGSSFVYNFTVDEPGTFWYHAHSGSLNAEGTTGMMVVYDLPAATSPSSFVQTTNQFGSFAYDEELRIILTDWYHPSAYTLNTMLEHNPFVWVGNGDSILINGKGESKHCSYNGTTTTLTATASDGTTTSTITTCTGKREIFALEKDKIYLVRVLNAAYLAFFNLAIAGHYFTVLGVDGGSYTEPVDVNSLDLSSGQRVMALLRFNHSAVDASSAQNETFLMQVQTDWRGPDTTHAGIAHAFVTYGNTSEISSTSVSPLVPPNESRNWHAWYDLVHAPTTTITNTVTSDTCPTDAEVTKVFQIDAVQQFVDMRTGRGLTPARIVPGAANTKLAWTVYNDSRLMMSATPYLLSAYLNTLNTTMPDVMVGARRLLSDPLKRILNTDARGMSSLTASVEQSNKLYSDRKAHLYDHYEIVSAGDGPGKNIARPRIVSDRSGSEARMQSTDAVEFMMMAPALHPLRIELGDVVDIVIQAYASITGGCDLHPWHLHGHSFWQISRGAGLYGDSAQPTYVSEYPLRQDTISGYPTNHSETRGESGTKGQWGDPCGWFKIRFRADNPGMWLFHCHIGWHMEMGMAVVFDEASELVPPPPADYGMCGAAGDYQTFTSFATTTVITNTTTRIVMAEAESRHGVVMHLLISFVVIFGVFLIVALLWVWLSRRKVNGMFVTLDSSTGAGELNANTMNPLSSLHESAGSEVDEERGAVQMVSRHHKKTHRPHTSRKDGASSSGYESCNNDKDESEEMVEVSFVRSARSAVQKYQSDKTGQKHHIKPSDEVSASDDEVSVGSISNGASHPVRKPLTWTSSQGLKN